MTKDRHRCLNDAPIVRHSRVAAALHCSSAYSAPLYPLGGRSPKEVRNVDLCSERMANEMP